MPIAIPLIAAVVAFGAAWTAQDWRYTARIDKMVATYADARLAAASAARAQEQVLSTKVIEAQNAQVKRTRALQADATAARTERDQLRDTNASALRLSGDSPAACTVYANAASVVLTECAAVATDLARSADGHAGDAKTLMDAWPVTSGPP